MTYLIENLQQKKCVQDRNGESALLTHKEGGRWEHAIKEKTPAQKYFSEIL